MLTTPRLLLRPLLPSDVGAVFEMSREPGMRRWIPDQVYADETQARAVVGALSAFTAAAPHPAAHPFVLGIEHAGALIGHVGLSPARGSVEIGYAVTERLQGRGFATEAVAAMAAWGLETLELPEVLGVVAADNAASCRVLAKAGFVRVADEGIRRVYRRT